MKKILLLLVFIPGSLYMARAQNFTITEKYNSTKTKQIAGPTAIVDINSDLEVKLNKNNITAYLTGKLNPDSKTSVQLATLTKLLQNEVKVLQLLQTKITPATTHAEQIKTLGEYSLLMKQLITGLKADPELRKEANRLIAEYLANASTLDAELYPNAESYLIINLSLQSKKELAGLTNGALGNVQVLLKAYLNGKNEARRKVHITNFDNYAAGEFYEVPRWVTNFSKEDIANYNAASQLAATANGLINSSTTDIKKLLLGKLGSAECIQALLADVQDIKANRKTVFSAEINAADNYIGQLETTIGLLKDNVDNLKNLGDGSGANVLERYNSLMQQFSRSADLFKTQTTSLAGTLPATLAANARLVALKANITSCLAKIKEDAELVAGVKNIITGMLKPIASTTNTIDSVAGESFALALRDLPDYGTIRLKETGKRQNGDQLYIAIYYRTKDEKGVPKDDVEFDNSTLTLQQINFYSVASVSAVLASPYNKSSLVKVNNKFQFAPAGSLLLKFGSRTSTLWNDISPGVGVIFATPDLDLDGSPDFSAGGTITLFKDVISLGLSYDTKTDSPFWHIGFSLPFTIIGGASNRPVSQ
jgi:hypothetical protein